jgi:integrase
VIGTSLLYVTNCLASRHLAKSFAGWKAGDITVTDLRAFIARRQGEGAANAEINRELATLRRGFNLALQADCIPRMPHFPRLQESPPRAGFFEADEFQAVLHHLPACLRGPVHFAYLTGWRCRSEVLPLQWRNIDFDTGTVRLDPGSTKNRDGRVIYMTAQLRALLEEQRRQTLTLQQQTDRIIPLVFHDCGRRIVNYDKRWREACKTAGVPAKFVHDLRRTAVRNMVKAAIKPGASLTAITLWRILIFRRPRNGWNRRCLAKPLQKPLQSPRFSMPILS